MSQKSKINGMIASSLAFNTPSRAVICSRVACTDVSMLIRVSASLQEDTTLLILAHSAFRMQDRASSEWAIEETMSNAMGQGQLLGQWVGHVLVLFSVIFDYLLFYLIIEIILVYVQGEKE